MTYEPKALDTSAVQLPAALLDLREQLAKNAHETWAVRRLSDGWRYGDRRDDAAKLHPCLVPYEELPESEKEYDRAAAMETLKTILAWGFQVTGPHPSRAPAPGAPRVRPPDWLIRGGDFSIHGGLRSFLDQWQRCSEWTSTQLERFYTGLAEELLALGENLLAYDAATEGLQALSEPGVRLRQLCGIALARSGATDQAQSLFEELYGEGFRDEETLGMRARVHKDLWVQSIGSSDATKRLQAAYDAYLEAFDAAEGYWTGINVATLAAIKGDMETANRFAKKIRPACLEEVREFGEDSRRSYWALATLGEAAVVLGAIDEAESWYGKAVCVGHAHRGNISSTHRQAKLLVSQLGMDADVVDDWGFPKWDVIAFAGYAIRDLEGGARRLPHDLGVRIKESMIEHLRAKGESIVAYSSAMSGADLLFLEAVRELKGELYIVLPFEDQGGAESDVDVLRPSDWKARCERIIQDAAGVMRVLPHRVLTMGLSHEYAHQVLLGLARNQARQRGGRLSALAVWNGERGQGSTETASIISQWASQELDFRWIDISSAKDECPDLIVGGRDSFFKSVPPSHVPHIGGRELRTYRTLLFADVRRFSELKDDQYPLFAQHFLGLVGQLTDEWQDRIGVKNTWGDGIFVVFDNVLDAGDFALTLSDRVTHTGWDAYGLPAGLSIRIALHAGPVHEFIDAVTKVESVGGISVSRAARVEPITPPGQVYASEPFAALASFERVSSFTCEYVGKRPLAKGFGTFATYHLQWAGVAGKNREQA